MGYSISAAETAKRLGISVRTLDRMSHREHPQHLAPLSHTAGGHRRYDADEVEALRTGTPRQADSAAS